MRHSLNYAHLLTTAIGILLAGPAISAEPTFGIRSGEQLLAFTRVQLWSHPAASEVRVAEDPAYANQTMTYRAVPAHALFEGFAVDADATIQFKCLDGFSASLDRDRLLNKSSERAIAYVAIEPAEKGWPRLKPDQEATAGPFYLVWVHPEKSGVTREEWPFQLAELEVKPPLAARFPQIAPDSSMARNSAVRRGYQVFTRNCFACHTLNLQGSSRMGPDLNVPYNPTEYLGEKFLRQLVRNPQSVRSWPESKMAGFDRKLIPDAALSDLMAYLKHMKTRKVRSR